MADIRSSGYKVAAQSALTTELNSLADNGWSALSSEIDNSTNKYLLADIEIVLASAAFAGADSDVAVYILPSVDGTNFPNFTASGIAEEQENEQYFVGAVTTSGATEAQRMALRKVEIPPGKWKIGIRNRAGVALAASGNTVSWRPFQFETV